MTILVAIKFSRNFPGKNIFEIVLTILLFLDKDFLIDFNLRKWQASFIPLLNYI